MLTRRFICSIALPVNQTSDLSLAPQVKDFLNAQAYLSDVYAWRSSRSRSFSYARWARELGFKSRSFLRMIIMGKRRITENSVALFIKGMKLSKSDGEYFAAMVRFTQAESSTAREYYAEEIARLRRHLRPSASQLVHDHFRFLASHHGPRVQTLLSLSDLRKTPSVLANLLEIPDSLVTENLESLERLGMARVEESKHLGSEPEWSSNSNVFEVKTSLGDAALQSFHRKSLEESLKAIESNPSERRYQSILIPLTADEYEGMVAELQRTMTEFLNRNQSDIGEKRRLYQLNANLIPVSQTVRGIHLHPPKTGVSSRQTTTGEGLHP